MRRISDDHLADVRQLAWRGDTSLLGSLSRAESTRPASVEIERSALHQAVASGKTGAVEALLISGTSVDKRDEYGQTALHIAVEIGDLQMAEYLVSKGANLNMQDIEGNTPLHVAARTRDIELANFLLYRGADLKLANAKGWTALHAAVNAGDRDLSQALLLRGADPMRRDKQGISPFEWAQKLQHLDILDIFKQKLGMREPPPPRVTPSPSEMVQFPQPVLPPRPKLVRLPPTPFPGIPPASAAAVEAAIAGRTDVPSSIASVATPFGAPARLLVARVHDSLKVDGLVALSRIRNYGGSTAVFREWAGWCRLDVAEGVVDALRITGDGAIVVGGLEILCQAAGAAVDAPLVGVLPGKAVLHVSGAGRLRLWVNGAPWVAQMMRADAPGYRADLPFNPGRNLVVFAWEPPSDTTALRLRFEDSSPAPHAVLTFV